LNGAIVLLSGGIDSATALYWTLKQTSQVYSMNILYAQASFQEAKASRSLASAAQVKEHLSVSLPFYADIQARYHPKGSSKVITAYVPARNTVFYGVAAAFAEAFEIDTIVFGSNADDTKELPDATPDFIQSMNDLLKLGTRAGADGTPITIVNPLINHRKIDVLKLALELKVPLEVTWSCYEDVQSPCGKCRGCRNRLDAFEKLGMSDPLKYERTS